MGHYYAPFAFDPDSHDCNGLRFDRFAQCFLQGMESALGMCIILSHLSARSVHYCGRLAIIKSHRNAPPTMLATSLYNLPTSIVLSQDFSEFSVMWSCDVHLFITEGVRKVFIHVRWLGQRDLCFLK